MSKIENSLSLHPDTYAEAIVREPIAVGPESIGVHFRNQAEVDDVKEYLDGYSTKGPKIGLSGSRINGRFWYDADKLFAKLFTYGADILDEWEYDYLRINGIPTHVREHLEQLSSYLKKQITGHENISDIDLSTFPSELQTYVKIRRFSTPLIFIPEERRSDPYYTSQADLNNIEAERNYMLIHPIPAFFVPDIDIVSIEPEKSMQPYESLPKRNIFGKRSGTHIHHTEIPGNMPEGLKIVVDSLVGNYRPFVYSANS